MYMYIFILMFECEPCGFCHVLVGFELICFRFMLSMAWSSTCFQSSIFVFRLPLPILLCFPPSSFLQLLIFPPIHHSHILSRPCNPHAPLMTFPCSSYHAFPTPMFMPYSPPSFLSLHRVMHPFVFLKRSQPLFCAPSQPMLVPPHNPRSHPHFHTHATNLSHPLITH